MLVHKSGILSILAVLSLMVFSACSDEGGISEIPAIEFVSIEPSQANNFDSVKIVISYQDGDGDLGENVAGVSNLFVTDNRNSVTYDFRVKELAPQGSSISIQGNLNIIINAVSVIDPIATSEEVSYSVYVVDRAGNQSNVVTTDAITVTK